MGSKLYEVWNKRERLASNMDLNTALLLIRTYCETYYNESVDLRLVEMEKNEVQE